MARIIKALTNGCAGKHAVWLGGFSGVIICAAMAFASYQNGQLDAVDARLRVMEQMGAAREAKIDALLKGLDRMERMLDEMRRAPSKP